MVEMRQQENLHLDFKLVDGPGTTKGDRRNLSKALSGFANSDGGVIVWGVDARKGSDEVDCAQALVPISRLSLFMSRLAALTGECVAPDVDGVAHKSFDLGGDRGFAVTYVPQSDRGPHMAKAGEHCYYKRNGAQFLTMEHFDIEDMFGRRAKPRLELVSRYRMGPVHGIDGVTIRPFQIILGLKNDGRGTASGPFLALEVIAPYRVQAFDDVVATSLGSRDVSGVGAFRAIQVACRADVVIHPSTHVELAVVDFELSDALPDAPPLVVNFRIAAENFRLSEGTSTFAGAEIASNVRRGGT